MYFLLSPQGFSNHLLYTQGNVKFSMFILLQLFICNSDNSVKAMIIETITISYIMEEIIIILYTIIIIITLWYVTLKWTVILKSIQHCLPYYTAKIKNEIVKITIVSTVARNSMSFILFCQLS